MKFLTRILSLLILAGISAFYVGCKPDDPEMTDEEKQFIKLASSWSLTSANDGTDRTADFPGLVLTISGTFAPGATHNYSLTGTRPNPSPWPGSGTWKFGTNPLTEIIRDPAGGNGEIDMTYQVTDNALILEFNIPSGHTGWQGGRIESVTGDWRFEFSKQ